MELFPLKEQPGPARLIIDVIMDAKSDTPEDNLTPPHFVKTNIPNLNKPEPMGTYYGQCKVRGKLVQESVRTKDSC